MSSDAQAAQRVVITGIGVTHALGLNISTFWENLLAGQSGLGPVTYFETEEYTCKVASQLLDFDATAYLDPKVARRNDPYTHYAVASAKEAIKDAKIDLATTDPDRLGVFVGSGIGGMNTIEEQLLACYNKGPRKVSPFMIPSLITNMAGGIIAIELKARGPNLCTVSACSTSAHAMGEAFHTLKRGEADIILAGGSEAAITRSGFAGFCSAKAMSTHFNDTPEKASRPFDKDRDGFVMGEGAGILVLETLESAQKRGARIYCEMVGYATTNDAHHITMPDPEGKGLGNAMRLAVQYAGLEPSDVDYINAHGTSTPYNDKFETLAIKSVFGEHAREMMVSSTKSMTGHLLGAAGAVEAATCAKSIETGWVAPTINYDTPDPDCDLDYVPNEKRQAKVEVALNNSLGFGGHNVSLVFRRFA